MRSSETDFRLVECFDGSTNTCTLTPSCRLKGLFGAALQAYFKELDGATLADITGPAPPAPGSKPASHRASTAVPISAPVTRRRAPAKHTA